MYKAYLYWQLACAFLLQRWRLLLAVALVWCRRWFPRWFEPEAAQLLRAALVRRDGQRVQLTDVTAALRPLWRANAHRGLPWRAHTRDVVRAALGAEPKEAEALGLEYSLHGKGHYGAWFGRELCLPRVGRGAALNPVRIWVFDDVQAPLIQGLVIDDVQTPPRTALMRKLIIDQVLAPEIQSSALIRKLFFHGRHYRIPSWEFNVAVPRPIFLVRRCEEPPTALAKRP